MHMLLLSEFLRGGGQMAETCILILAHVIRNTPEVSKCDRNAELATVILPLDQIHPYQSINLVYGVPS